VKVSVVVGAAGVLGFGLGAKRVDNLFACLPTLRSGDWETVPSVDDVCRVEGFAKNMAEKVVIYFPMMTSFLRTCVDNGIQLESIEVDDNVSKNVSKNESNRERKIKICLSGFRDKALEKKYNVLTTVTKDCEVLVCNSFEKETVKMMKAKKLGVKMVLLAEFDL
jgi:DNA ligase (NAD+)